MADTFEDDDFDYEDDFEVECGLGPDGYCSMAGTEHCDWECGALNAQRIEVMKMVAAIRTRAKHRAQKAQVRASTTPKRAKVKAARKQRNQNG